MMKRSFLFSLFTITILASCSKGGFIPNEFRMDGLRDISMGTSVEARLPLQVVPVSGLPEPVTITVDSLPAGIRAEVRPAEGTTGFSPTVIFRRSGPVSSGRYPACINAVAPSCKKSYILNLDVSDFNGWVADSAIYRSETMDHFVYPTHSVLRISSPDHASGVLFATVIGQFPTADGTYKYHLYNSGNELSDMGLKFNSTADAAVFNSTGEDRRDAVLTVRHGSYSLTFPPTDFADYTWTMKKKIAAAVYK